MLSIEGLSYRAGARVLFESASLAVSAGQKVGVVGRNGSGKTTLFRLIAGEAQPEAGAVTLRRGVRLGRVAQEAPEGSASLLETVLAADGERADLLAEAETASDPGRIGDIHARLADIGAHSAPARAAAVLAGLGFDDDAQARPCGGFSGGWRMRVALAAALVGRPELLLLDEPTNHLDLEASLWLEGYLAAWRGTLLVISHDRTLLNKVAREIVHLEDQKLVRYAGNYDRFEKTRRERLVRETRMRDRQQRERKHIKAFVDRFRAKATKARQAQSRLKMLERMEPVVSVIEEKTATFHFPDAGALPPPLITMDRVAAGYGDGPPVLDGLDLRIDMDDRIALIGANGNGKSTLSKLLAGRLQPLAGTLRKARKLRIGYFAQHQADELDLDATAFRHLARAMPDTMEARVRAHLGAFGFAQDRANIPARNLSGGEKTRLLFAVMSTAAPHILLLDEPTNHLDVDAREALVEALNAYEGAVVLVSHDAHLIELVCDRLWLVAGGGCQSFDGDLDDYRALVVEERRAQRRATRASPRPGRKDERRRRAAQRGETAALRKSVSKAEARLQALNKETAVLEARLADPAVYGGPTAALQELQVRLGEVKKSLAEAENTWLRAHEALEAAD